MKIRIKTHNGELPSYLTVGKVYDVVDGYVVSGDIFVRVDMGMCIPVNLTLDNCRHLNGGSWEVVSDQI